MPWEMHWVPPATNAELVVHESPPPGYSEWPSFCNVKILRGDGPGKWAYECWRCKGWIYEHPGESQENSLGPLCGRRGTAYYCVRCGFKIGFSGMVS